MRIDEILNKKRTLSFEVFPPKYGDGNEEDLIESVRSLKKLNPDFISVTYGANGSNARNAVKIAGAIKREGVEPLAHITCGCATPESLNEVCGELRDEGVENVLCLRGDRPQTGDENYCKHFNHATDLLSFINGRGFIMGAACYPEGHPECSTLYHDLEALKLKQDAGAKFLITQMFFDNEYYYRLVAEARKIGVTVPIIPGIMPLLSVKNIAKIKQMCGSTIPIDFRNMIEIYSSKPAVMKEIGLNYAVYQIIDLIAKGAPGIHLYIMNRAETAEQIHTRLKTVFDELF